MSTTAFKAADWRKSMVGSIPTRFRHLGDKAPQLLRGLLFTVKILTLIQSYSMMAE